MSTEEIEVFSYRWVVLFLFFLINVVIQILWITFAPVNSIAQNYYGVGKLEIDLLSLTFMFVYIPVTLLASWLIDIFDFKIGAGIGALIMGIFGFLRALAGPDFVLLLIFQTGVAVAQPFILNAVTKLSANWFPETERTTATGISLLSTFIGVALGLILTPLLYELFNSFEIIIWVYGVIALASGIIFFVFAKAKPPKPPTLEIIEEKVFMFDGLKRLFTNKYFYILILIYFVGLGVFNTITTYIEGIMIPKVGAEEAPVLAGIVGLLLLIGGILGTIIFSVLSDVLNKRKPLIFVSLLIATVSLFLFSFLSDPLFLMILGFVFGFGLLGASPVGLEYAVDLTKPVPEASSNGILLMSGQIGGILLFLGLQDFTIGKDYWPALVLQAILLTICTILTLFVKEYKIRKE
ncbi:MAG: MFS transporter [Promethearchaeota archaeon]